MLTLRRHVKGDKLNQNFIKGLDLSELFFKEAVKNLLEGKDIDDPTKPLDLKDLQITKTLRGTYKGTFDTSVKFENYDKEKIQKELEKLLRHKYGEDGPKTYRDEIKRITCEKKSVENFLEKTELKDFSKDIS